MSDTRKSPRKVLATARTAAKTTLPAYNRGFSPKTFTQHQLLACLVLKAFLGADYRDSLLASFLYGTVKRRLFIRGRVLNKLHPALP